MPDDLVPVSTSRGPMFDNLFRRQIQHLFEAVVIGERGLVLSDFPELSVKLLDDVGGIYDSSDLRRICVKGAENIPVVLPAFDAGRILFSPVLLECRQPVERFIFCDRLIHRLEVGHQRLDIFPTDIAGGGTDLMNDTPLDSRHRVRGGNRFPESG